MKFSLKKFKRKIAANSQTDIDVYGDKVFARSVPAGCKIKFDDGEAVDFYTGLRFGVNSWLVDMLGGAFPALAAKLSSNVFRKISIINENSSAVDVEVIAGFGDISDDSTVINGTLRVDSTRRFYSMGIKDGITGSPVFILPFQTQAKEYFIQNRSFYDCKVYLMGGEKHSYMILRGGDSVVLPPPLKSTASWAIKPLNSGEKVDISYMTLLI